jgi:hypothetical protein
MKILLLLLMIALGATPAPESEEAPFAVELAPGDYVVVGREPNGGAAYAGSARIERSGKQLSLKRRLGDGSISELVGTAEAAVHGEVQVLRFRGAAAKPRTMTCLERGDLDNYLRFTCYWTYDADPHPKEPGLETLFPTGAWPDDAPNKKFAVP